MRRLSLLIIFFILLGGFILRLYKFNAPLADWHSWRQTDTSAVSRNFVNEGFDLLHPRFDDLSNVPTSGAYDNPQGYRFVEFPIYNIFQAGFYKLFGFLTIEQWGRLVTIFSSIASIVFIYLLVKKYTDETVALAASFFYAFIPFNIFYGRAILPDPLSVAAILGGTYFFDKWTQIDVKHKHTAIRSLMFFLLSAIFTSLAFLLKPFTLFFTLPMIAIAYNAYGISFFRKWQLWVFLIITVLPIALWRIWMTQFPEGIPASDWLFNGGNIRFKGAFFYWIFAERIGGLILGFWGLPLFVMGILLNSKAEKLFNFKRGQQLLFWSFLLSSLVYVTIIARGNVQHDYYQILIIPSIVIFTALGCKFLLNPPKEYISRSVGLIILAVCIGFGLSFRWYAVRDFFNINNASIVEAGKIVDEVTPKDSKVIAVYGGDTTFLYHTKRRGWASQQRDLSAMVKLGAGYLALANPVPADFYYKKFYKIVYSSDTLLLYDLNQKP